MGEDDVIREFQRLSMKDARSPYDVARERAAAKEATRAMKDRAVDDPA